MGIWSSSELLCLPDNLEARGLRDHVLKEGAGTQCPEQRKKAWPIASPCSGPGGNATVLCQG